ncbi:hypothetical protein [uncultured Gimesia sp.]|uniref:hypothetical protein n=1 Tax=uncultured Gimesia sp. TaxID=1678688 RepID=UPI0030DA82A4|tara:strand:- start:28861 stop:29394 length:534 start_codon:yes stop_codon:yes gene_type:complete
MSQVSRRDAVKMVAGMGIVATGVGVIATRDSDSEAATKQKETTGKPEPATQVAEKEDGNSKRIDKELESALKDPSMFYFLEQVTFKKPDRKYRLIFTSAYSNPEWDSQEVKLDRTGSMRIFRAIADQDEFTRQGGLYWKNHKTTGKIQFKHPGALVLAVCELDGTVNCYSLMHDFRC